MQRWSKAQRSLIDLGQERVARGHYCIDAVSDESDLADEQVERALEHVERASADPRWEGPLNVKLASNRHWNAVCSLSEKAGTKGNGYVERMFNAFRAFKAQGHKHLCLWLYESRQLGMTDQEGLAFLLAYAAENVGIKVRIVFLTGKVERFVHEKHRRLRVPCVLSGRLRARYHQITREGLELLPLEGQVNERESAAALSA